MSTKIELTILGQPMSLKNASQIIVINNKGALKKNAEAMEYERSSVRQIPESARQMLTGPVRVTMRLFYTWEGPDLSEDFLLDILAARYKRVKGKMIKIAPGEYGYGKSERVLVQRGVYENDRQVRSKRIDHFIDKVNPRAEIEVEAMEMQQPSLLDAVPLLHTAGSPDPF